jgi:hypothetical protein
VTDGAAGVGASAGAAATSAAGGAASAAGGAASASLGTTARISPSRSALRRTRSAWASTMLDEWLFTPMPSAMQRSSASLFSKPSSRASS